MERKETDLEYQNVFVGAGSGEGYAEQLQLARERFMVAVKQEKENVKRTVHSARNLLTSVSNRQPREILDGVRSEINSLEKEFTRLVNEAQEIVDRTADQSIVNQMIERVRDISTSTRMEIADKAVAYETASPEEILA